MQGISAESRVYATRGIKLCHLLYLCVLSCLVRNFLICVGIVPYHLNIVRTFNFRGPSRVCIVLRTTYWSMKPGHVARGMEKGMQLT